jgi:hypothetical protein
MNFKAFDTLVSSLECVTFERRTFGKTDCWMPQYAF